MLRLRRLAVFIACAYPAALLFVVFALRVGAPRFWQAELMLYVPRLIFALPLPFLVILLLVLRLRRVLWLQLATIWILAFPLMGLVLPSWPRRVADSTKTLRVLSYNGNFGYGGESALAAQVLELDPDIAVFQQLYFTKRIQSILGARYAHFEADGEFLIASRFHIRSKESPDPLPYGGRPRAPRFIRYEVETNLGPIVLYSVHPISPHYQLAIAHRGGVRRAIVSGSLLSPAPRPDIQRDSGLRGLQVRTFARMARREALPVIIAGDTNLPNLSAALDLLADYRDGFAEAGRGFGYTFPSNRPWMRIDRIFTSQQLRFLDFRVGTSRASDHLCVLATLEAEPR